MDAGADLTTIPIAEFLSLLLETLSFGILVVLYGIAVWILLYRRGVKLNKVLFTVSTIMLLLATVHLTFSIVRGFRGFLGQHENAGSTAIYYSNTSDSTFITKSIIYVTQTVLGDSFMAYRVFVVWNRSWAVSFVPVILLFGTTFAGYGACYDLSVDSGVNLATSTDVSPWLTTFLALATSFNLLTSALVILRIYRSKRRVQHYNAAVAGSGQRVLETFIQSAAIYSVVLLALFVTYVRGFNPEMFGIDILTALIGIAFILIIIRLGLGETKAEGRKGPKESLLSPSMALSPRSLEKGFGVYEVQQPRATKASPLIREEGATLSSRDENGEAGRSLLQAVEQAIRRVTEQPVASDRSVSENTEEARHGREQVTYQIPPLQL